MRSGESRGSAREPVARDAGRAQDSPFRRHWTWRDRLLVGVREETDRASEIAERPEFYDTFSNNCTTNILDPVNRIATRPIPYGVDVLLPGYSDRLAHRLGLIDTELGLEEARERFRVNERARAAGDAEDCRTLSSCASEGRPGGSAARWGKMK